MRWAMEAEEMEAVLERIWDLHDKISDAIHAISRAHFLKSIRTLAKSSQDKVYPEAEIAGGGGRRGGGGDGEGAGCFVFVKGFRAENDEAAMAEAKGLNAIRTALENLEDRLEYFHTVQSQQQVERDAALARLEQSRIMLAVRLADYHGKKYKVIEDAIAFVGNVQDTYHFIVRENIFKMPRGQFGENLENCEGKRSNALMHMLISVFELAKETVKVENFGSILGNAALFAISMLSLLQLHQVACKSETPHVYDTATYRKRNEKNTSRLDSSQGNQIKAFNVLSARG
ncbi:plastid division protein PDV1 [Elaeis guineensis]|uniref:Plastid division protein PDV1 n=1 Tax=Elaeis guineensis var. tenera TaxID=51953 RepID=A0A6I9QRZ3_ELAGV|nr:plastid division protein PDV1 [Elaeis guineensis]